MSELESKDNNKNVRIAVLGGTGRVGGWVLEEFLDRGYNQVRVLARTPSKLPER